MAKEPEPEWLLSRELDDEMHKLRALFSEAKGDPFLLDILYPKPVPMIHLLHKLTVVED